ncbi:family 16 glycosylhydrolase [Neiella sp. HB171785]|uniref:Family 16 glycosylhydrolase n=1 Tax=Neiella litorisoli TaxID=2771431 RepID=A0A8J6QSR5_9GAMM|nr:family 16 glycosylhydrolase [Neiella litorisoli]MBD1390139.1 family 16 glycosylhydrolase [Neiella litorisoli]
MKRLWSVLLLSAGALQAADWDDYPVPADAGEGMIWQLQSLSDDFNYKAPAVGKSDEFYSRWHEGFINPWKGPGLTEWHPEYSEVDGGMLHIKAGRKPGTNKVYAGSITSHQLVVYPLYLEVRAKLSNLVMASDFWLLSPDSTEEIDVLEAYGSDRPDQAWFAERLHLSHHVFIRDPFQDYQPSSADTWYTDGKTKWQEDFHRIGVYWRDPWHLEYYVDGKLVRTASGVDVIDPHNFTNGKGLTKPMHVIINTEDQDWRSGVEPSITPTDEELADDSKNTYLVDWVRFYKPVPAN